MSLPWSNGSNQGSNQAKLYLSYIWVTPSFSGILHFTEVKKMTINRLDIILIFLCDAALGAVRMPRWFSDNMVLQTNAEYGARSFLSGRANPGEEARVVKDRSKYIGSNYKRLRSQLVIQIAKGKLYPWKYFFYLYGNSMKREIRGIHFPRILIVVYRRIWHEQRPAAILYDLTRWLLHLSRGTALKCIALWPTPPTEPLRSSSTPTTVATISPSQWVAAREGPPPWRKTSCSGTSFSALDRAIWTSRSKSPTIPQERCWVSR